MWVPTLYRTADHPSQLDHMPGWVVYQITPKPVHGSSTLPRYLPPWHSAQCAHLATATPCCMLQPCAHVATTTLQRRCLWTTSKCKLWWWDRHQPAMLAADQPVVRKQLQHAGQLRLEDALQLQPQQGCWQAGLQLLRVLLLSSSMQDMPEPPPCTGGRQHAPGTQECPPPLILPCISEPAHSSTGSWSLG